MFNRKINILVTGADGQLGSYLVDFFKKKSFLKKSRIGKVFGIDIKDLDIRDASAVADFFNKNVIDPPVDIDYVVHCAAATDTAAIEKDPESYYAVNCLGTKNIAESCAYNGIKLVFISTDYVFSERSPFFGGKSQEFPVNQYGLQKLIAEQFAKEAYRSKPKDLLILRSSWMFGNSNNSFVEKFLRNAFKTYAKSLVDCSALCRVNVADDACGRPIAVWNIAEALYDYMLNSVHGTIDLQHQYGQISRHDWATMIWNAFMSNIRNVAIEDKELFDGLKKSVKVIPMHSKDIGISMHHPRKVNGVVSANFHIGPIWVYEADTVKYIDMNFNKFIEMAKKEVEDRTKSFDGEIMVSNDRLGGSINTF